MLGLYLLFTSIEFTHIQHWQRTTIMYLVIVVLYGIKNKLYNPIRLVLILARSRPARAAALSGSGPTASPSGPGAGADAPSRTARAAGWGSGTP